jgi:hypothetical protein
VAQQPAFVYSGSAFIPGQLARAEALNLTFTSVAAGFNALAIQGVDTGTANTYVVATSGGADGAYSDGLIVEFKAANTCTGGSTISVDGGTVVGLTNQAGQTLSAGAVTAGIWYLCRYNSTFGAFTIIAPTPATVTIGTISGAPPTYLVGLTSAGGVATAAAPIDARYALDQTISPTMTGSWTFAGAVTFNSTVGFAGGLTLTGLANAYAITLDGNSGANKSFGLEVNAGTTSSDTAILVNSQSGTQFLKVDGAGNLTVSAGNTTLGTGTLTVNSASAVFGTGGTLTINSASVVFGTGGTLTVNSPSVAFGTGNITVGSPTGGGQGSGTIDVSGGYYLNGLNIGPINAAKAATTSRSSTTTLTNDPDLAVGLPVAGTYKYEILLQQYMTTGTSQGFAFNTNYSGAFTAGSSDGIITMPGNGGSSYLASNTTQSVVNSAVLVAEYLSTLHTPTPYPISLSGVIVTTGTGTFAVAWAQANAGTNAANLGAGSYMTVTRVA